MRATKQWSGPLRACPLTMAVAILLCLFAGIIIFWSGMCWTRRGWDCFFYPAKKGWLTGSLSSILGRWWYAFSRSPWLETAFLFLLLIERQLPRIHWIKTYTFRFKPQEINSDWELGADGQAGAAKGLLELSIQHKALQFQNGRL